MGLIGMAIGIYMVVKAYYLNHHLLFLEWAEKKWGPGGGTTAYRMIGLGICLFSIFVMVGWIDLFGMSLGQNSGAGTNNSESGIRANPTGNTRGRIAE